MTAYWIARVTVNNQDRYQDYLDAAAGPFKEYGAKFLVRGGQYDAVEGEAKPRNIVIEFADMERARACYHSADYQKAAKIRQEAADADIIIVDGAD